jgi:hypothetical protein
VATWLSLPLSASLTAGWQLGLLPSPLTQLDCKGKSAVRFSRLFPLDLPKLSYVIFFKTKMSVFLIGKYFSGNLIFARLYLEKDWRSFKNCERYCSCC